MQRYRSLALALTVGLTLSLAASPRAHAEADSEDTGDESPAAGGADSAASSSSGTARRGVASKSKSKQPKKRRNGKVVGRVVPDSQLRTTPLGRPSGHLQLFNLNSREEVDLEIFNDDGSYDAEELRQADHILRCKRTETEKAVDPRLISLLSHIYDHYGKRIEIVSGYRNQRKQTSYHFKASASDIRVAGVTPKKLVQFAATLDTGGMGIGLYPRAKFVHIDVRPPPSYRWIDNARPTNNSRDKRPPKGWKRKKLQS